jgi:type I restriction enzyme, S subunit
MTLPKHSLYKESDVAWLGQIPTHWTLARIKDTTYLKGRVGWKGLTSDEYLEEGYAYLVTGTDFASKFISWKECHFVSQNRYEDDPFIQLKNGDLLITKDGTIGKLALVDGLDRQACLNSGIFLIRPLRSYTTAFMYWVLNSDAFRIFCDLSSLGSTIQHLYQNVFERFIFPVPNESEQRAIAEFLDCEISKIDALVSEQQRLMELLKEKRQAAIAHVVTKGLNSHAPMRESGIDWIGKAPEHWAITRLGYFARIENGSTPSRDTPEYWLNGVVPWLSSGEVNQYRVVEAEQFISESALKQCSLRLLPIGTIIVGMIGQGKTRGMSASLQIEACINQNLAAVVLGPRLLSDYVLYLFQSMYEYLREFGRGGNQSALNCEILSALKIPVPPLNEQSLICAEVEMQLRQFDALEHEAKRSNMLLNERRATLISAAVTGQIDVRQHYGT